MQALVLKQSWMSLGARCGSCRYLALGNSGNAGEGVGISGAERVLGRLKVVTCYQSVEKYFDILRTSCDDIIDA